MLVQSVTTQHTADVPRLPDWSWTSFFYRSSRIQVLSLSCSSSFPFFFRRLCKLERSCTKPFKYGESATVQEWGEGAQSITKEKRQGWLLV